MPAYDLPRVTPRLIVVYVDLEGRRHNITAHQDVVRMQTAVREASRTLTALGEATQRLALRMIAALRSIRWAARLQRPSAARLAALRRERLHPTRRRRPHGKPYLYVEIRA